ncbi:MAG TPA: enoyl-CoA hydratase/isomerase family protein [Burkholderiales bacterium]|jgi:enoyl-CoA hydratase/carnithine racemase|nr:enoyl-CoA hydratase/isomerase family protein [Burkholderiales bacterium]
MYATLKVESKGAVAIVTLNRAEARNAMSAQLMREMIACAGKLGAKRELDVVIVRGAGKWFSAGADLRDARRWGNGGLPLDQQREIASLGYRMARAWEELPQITIAAIEGYAIGGGLALAAALDWRVIAADAFVSLPEIALGIPLTWGTLPRLVNLVGPARAKRLAILCERIPAAEAKAMALVDCVAPPGKAMAEARALAKKVLALPRNSVRMTKESVNAYASIGAHAASHMAHDQVQLAAASAEARAAREAFSQRRKTQKR